LSETQVQVEGKYFYECPSCHSRYFAKPVMQVGIRSGKLCEIPPVCMKCFNACACGQRKVGEEKCSVCNEPRSRVTLARYAIPDDDPALGISTTGSATAPSSTQAIGTTTSTAAVAAGYETAFAITPTVSGTVTKIGIHTTVGAGHQIFAIFADSSGSPGTLLGTTNSVASAVGWVDGTLATPVYVVAGTPYWIAYETDSGSLTIHYTSGTNTQKYNAHAYGSFANPFGSPTTTTNVFYMRITYIQVKGYTKGTRVQFTDPTGAPVTSFSFYTHVGGAGDHFTLALYDDSGGNPNHLLWYSPSTGSASTTWNVLTEGTGTRTNGWAATLINGAYYWLMWQWDNVDTGPSYAVGGANTGIYLAQAYGTLSSTWAGGTLSTENWSEYATYTATLAITDSGSGSDALSTAASLGAADVGVGVDVRLIFFSIVGRVIDSVGNPIVGATLWLFKTSDESFVATATSNGSGNYAFVGVTSDVSVQYFIRGYSDSYLGARVFGTTDRTLVAG
jgi:hypothetical protein